MPAANQQVAPAFLALLRQSTTAQHIQLEETKLSKALLSNDVSPEDYTAYLLKMQAVIFFCEHTIFPLIKDIIPVIDERRKLPLINKDLEYLGNQQPAINNFHPFDNSISAGFAMGYMYVIEGSTLGGRVILKHISDKLGVTENNGGSFFAGYGVTTGSKWKNFIETLVVYEEKCKCGDEIIEGAKQAFESIYNFF